MDAKHEPYRVFLRRRRDNDGAQPFLSASGLNHTTMPNGHRRAAPLALLLAFIAAIGGGLVGGWFVVVWLSA